VRRNAIAIFQGHDHVYERGCLGGIDYMIAGGGGAPLYSVDATAQGVIKAVEDYSYLVVSVSGSSVTAQAKLADGGVIESFELPSAQCGGPKPGDGGTVDAGSDAGSPDAGVPDAGQPDAGAPDAGAADGGPDAALAGGCSCASGSLAGWGALPLLAVLALLRRRR